MDKNGLDILKLLGIDAKDGKIDIDLNKTKNFFNSLQTTLEEKAKKIDEDIKNDKLNLEEVGVKIDKEHISLDLTQTKSFFENLTKKIEGFAKEIEKSLNEIKKPLNKRQTKQQAEKSEDNSQKI